MTYSVDHTKLTILGQSLGYPEEEGLCNGVAHKARQAVLCQDMPAFYERIKKIHLLMDSIQCSNIPFSSQEASKFLQRKIWQIDSSFETDLRAWLDGVYIAQNASAHKELFGDSDYIIYSQMHRNYNKVVSPFTAPEKLKKLGGDVEITRFTGMYSKEEMRQYFATLKKVFEESDLQHPVALECVGVQHIITVGYDPIVKEWFFVDANRLSTKKIDKEDSLADMVFSSIAGQGSKMAAMATLIYCTKEGLSSVEPKMAAWMRTQQFQSMHTITPTKVKAKAQALSNGIIVDTMSWFFIAVRMGDLKTVQGLIRAGTNVNESSSNGFSPFQLACQGSDIDMINLLLTSGANIHKTNDSGIAAIHMTANIGNIELLQLLLDYGANLQQQAFNGVTPLMIAVMKKNGSMVQFLLKKGAQVNTIAQGGHTALLMAIALGDIAIVKMLLAAGADGDVADNQGENPFSIALKTGNKELILLFMDPQLKAAYQAEELKKKAAEKKWWQW